MPITIGQLIGGLTVAHKMIAAAFYPIRTASLPLVTAMINLDPATGELIKQPAPQPVE